MESATTLPTTPQAATATPKPQVNSDEIVGMVAYEITKLNFTSLLIGSDAIGGVLVLSGFTPRQLAGVALAAKGDGDYSGKVSIQYPASELSGFGIPEEFLVDRSAVAIRNSHSKYFGKVIITTDTERDAGASLREKETTKADQLKDGDKSVQPWIKILSDRLNVSFPAETQKQIGAMMRGLFDCGRFTVNNLASYLFEVLDSHNKGIPLPKAAGLHLPKLGLPLYEDCFVSLMGPKSGQASQWAKRFGDHEKNEAYLDKREPTGDLLENTQLLKKLGELREDTNIPLPDEVLKAFEDYIREETRRGPATQRLLFEHDWSFVRECFDAKTKISARKFAEETQKAIEYQGKELTPYDKSIIEWLNKTVRKSGDADEEIKKFFAIHGDSIAAYVLNKSLILDWEDFVYGRRIVCDDFLRGILECLQRISRITTPGTQRTIIIEGVKQSKPANFEDLNWEACRFFERSYGRLPFHSGNLIRFETAGKGKTLLPVYSTDVAPKLGQKGKGKVKRTKKAKGLEFHITIKEGENRLATIPLAWNFASDSVLALETKDLDALLKHAKKTGSALALGLATYENVGNKGVPPPVCLHSVAGLGSSPGANGKGTFIPKADAIVSLRNQFIETVDEAAQKGWLETADELKRVFEKFNTSYLEAVASIRRDGLDRAATWPMVTTFNTLMGSVRSVQHQSTRKKLIRALLQVGSVTVAESNHRPPLAIICPWHPQRMEAVAARNEQVLRVIRELLTSDTGTFSDGRRGSLFFRDILELTEAPLQPDVTAVWKESEVKPMVLSQALGGYTLHESPENSTQASALENSAAESSATIMREVEEYLRLRPHERDSFSILLYNCDSPDLPGKLVEDLNKRNKESKEGKITCQVLLTHSDEQHLQELYKKLVAGADDQLGQAEETTGSFLSKVRINITAANRLFKDEGASRPQPADIAYCRDLLSHHARPEWEWIQRRTYNAIDLRAHQWNRTRPFVTGESTTKVLLCCPVQTETGWNVLHAIACCSSNGADDAWNSNKCAVLIRTLSFDNKEVGRIIDETHKLAVWVVNQDELLDRRILEDKGVRVIRYIQSTTQGRNLVISSKAREFLLRNTIEERLKLMLPTGTPEEDLKSLVERIISEANGISGGLVLKAARRANHTSELFGIVLSKYIIQSEIGLKQPAAWCFLDDFRHWLGKEEGTNIADLLVLSPTFRDGKPHMNILVTEAKFIAPDALAAERADSEKQLSDTLLQITQALSQDNQPLDQDLWLSRISDMLLSRTTGTTGEKAFDLENWRTLIRERKCTFSVWGYSHIFVHTATDAQISECKGVKPKDKGPGVQGFQEVFDWGKTRALLLQMHVGKTEETKTLRQQNGLPEIDHRVTKLKQSEEKPQEPPKPSGTREQGTNPAPPPDSDEDEGKSTMKPVEPKPGPVGGGASEVSPRVQPEDGTMPATQSPAVLNFLIQKAERTDAASAEAREWLQQTSQKLKTALVQKGLSAVTPEGLSPILTPNAAIVKFKGGPNMTVAGAEKYADELFTSEGLRILSVSPEAGRVSFSVARDERQVLQTPNVFLQLFKRGPLDAEDERVFVGIREEDGNPHFLNPYNQPHTLVAGATGSGKSVLIRNILLYIALCRTPDQAHIYLIDAKRGVDYAPIKYLPHVERGSGKIIDKTEESLKIFEELVEEMEKRYDLFVEEDVENCQAYRRKTGKTLPTLWIVHDEFADWMKIKEYCDGVTTNVDRLSIKARGAGIFLIFAAQRPDNTVMPMQLRSQLLNRLILKVADPGTSDIATGEKQRHAEKLLPKGHMLAKTDDDFVYTQVPFIRGDEVPALVQLIRLHYGETPAKSLPAV